MKPLLITQFTAVSCLGTGLAQTLAALSAQRSGLAPCRFDTVDIDTFVGQVAELEGERIAAELARFDCRNNRLAQLALRQDEFSRGVRDCIARHGAGRVGLFLGTSTSGIFETERAYRRRDPFSGALPAAFHYAETHNAFAVTEFVRQVFSLHGPAVAISCACASSAKVFAAAQRMIQAGLIDAALVGGIDSLCLTTLYGFHSLQLTSTQPCRPFDAARDGISIGEAAAFALLERTPDSCDAGAFALLGAGESSDAHHMSSPHPEGLGAKLAIEAALHSAQLDASDIDYVNLHGTGTPGNDRSESKAMNAVFGTRTPCSSTKAATGHTLGAAGALEAVISLLTLQSEFMPAGLNVSQPDPVLQLQYVRENQPKKLRRVLSNSFGFGGTNCSLIFGRIH